jgi:hypothetical protein
MEEIKQEKPIIAGAEIVKEADNNIPEKEKTTCIHEYSLERVILHRKSIFSSGEILASVIFCKKCGCISGSSKISS